VAKIAAVERLSQKLKRYDIRSRTGGNPQPFNYVVADDETVTRSRPPESCCSFFRREPFSLQRFRRQMSATPHIPTFHFSQLSMSDPPVPFLAPSDLGSSPTPFDLSASPPPPLLPLPSPSTSTRPDQPLFLGIDSGVDRLKACVLDEELRVVWTAKVDIDQELREYGCVPVSRHHHRTAS
jgi:hypothetical protein